MAEGTPAAHEVYDRLFVGPWMPAANKGWLEENKITHVISMTPDHPPLDDLDGISTHHFPIEDSVDADLSSVLTAATTTIRTSLHSSPDARVLLHCNAGQSRSGAVALWYMVEEGMSLKDAYERAKGIRENIEPNIGFWKTLIQLEEEKRGAASVDAHEKAIDILIAFGSAGERVGDEVRAVARRCLEEKDWNLTDAFAPFFEYRYGHPED